MTHNFALLALDQVVNEAAKMRYMSGGQLSVPIVFRGPNGPAEYLASQHSQALASYWVHVPGLKVVAPATPADAYGLLKSAIRDDDPVVILESEMLYGFKGEVPDEEFLIPIGKAEVRRPGTDLTLVTYSKPALDGPGGGRGAGQGRASRRRSSTSAACAPWTRRRSTPASGRPTAAWW